MRKIGKKVGFCLLLAILFWCGTLLADRITLHRDVIRLHVVAHSDSLEDQALKLQVRDAVIECLGGAMEDLINSEQAQEYLQTQIPMIRETALQVLRENGVSDSVRVTLCKEAFDTRVYDTFTLPAGVYESLRITIGQGQGKNWWCVVFPSLCMPAVSEGFADVAAGAGFPDALTQALSGEDGYEMRFFLLDALGKLENIFFTG